MYADLLEQEGIASQFLMVLKPRRKVTGFTLYAGSVYSMAFAYGTVVTVECDGVALTAGTSAVLSAGQFYWDEDVLYVRTSDSVDPDTKFTTAVYELYMGTFDAHWNRDPLDAATRVVYFDPLIAKSPLINQSSSDGIFGYLPISSTSIELGNAEHTLEPHLYDGSFNQAEVKMYHWLGTELDADNIKLVFNGVCSDVGFEDATVSIRALDRTDILGANFRYPTGESFFATSDFPDLDPNEQARPIRQVFGIAEGFVPVNIDYVAQAPTTSDNREWVFIKGQASLGNVITLITAAGTNTTTRTYVTSVVGLQVADTVWLDRLVGVDQYTTVTAVGANFIDHDAIAAPMVAGDAAKRSFVGNLTILQANTRYRLLYGRDFFQTNYAADTAGVTLSPTLEVDLAMTETFKPQDLIYGRVYGHTNTSTFGGDPVGGNDTVIGTLTNPVTILYEMLKTYLSIPESQIDGATFISLAAATTEAVGFAVPATSKDNFPQVKEIISQLGATSLLRLFLNNDTSWTTVQLGPAGSSTKTIDDTEILRDSFKYSFEHGDIISDSIVEYASREVGDDQFNGTGTVSRVNTLSDTARYLHKVKRQRTFPSLHFRESDAQKLADRLSYILGDRKGTVSINTKNRFFDTLLGDVITTSRVSLPGFTFDLDTEHTLDLVVLETAKSLGEITITLDDQKGIEDNSGSWT